MSRRSHAVSEEDQVYDQGTEQLEVIMRENESSLDELRRAFITATETYEAGLKSLTTRRTEVIRTVAKRYPETASLLNDMQHLKIPLSGKLATEKRGYFFQYRREDWTEEVADCSGVTNDSPEQNSIKADTIATRSPTRPTKISTSTPADTQHTKIVPLTLEDRKIATEGGNRSVRSKFLSTCHLTDQPAIAKAEVQIRGYWVFQWKFAKVDGNDTVDQVFFQHYVLKCPSRICCKPIFNNDPFTKNRARDHLERCGQPFRDDVDILKRYARLVVGGQNRSRVTRQWINKQNGRLASQQVEADSSERQ